MKKTLIALVAVLAAAVIALPASAITDGSLDGDAHPYVGLMVAQDIDGNPLWRCSGTLISPTLFLTAGHCTEAPAAHAEIWFDADVQSGVPGNGYPNTGDVGGTTFTHPQYDPNAFYLHDLGVVVLDTPVVMSAYGSLPTLNQLDALKSKHVVPSHGPRGDAAIIEGYRVYLTRIKTRAAALKREHKSEADTIQIITDEMSAQYPDKGRLGGAIRAAYAEANG